VTATRRPPEHRALPEALVHYCATGEYTTGGGLDVFLFAERLLRFAPPGPASRAHWAAADALERLWREHRDEIRAAARGREPWCAKWLRAHPPGERPWMMTEEMTHGSPDFSVR
jgi:hypothetical protein